MRVSQERTLDRRLFQIAGAVERKPRATNETSNIQKIGRGRVQSSAWSVPLDQAATRNFPVVGMSLCKLAGVDYGHVTNTGSWLAVIVKLVSCYWSAWSVPLDEAATSSCNGICQRSRQTRQSDCGGTLRAPTNHNGFSRDVITLRHW